MLVEDPVVPLPVSVDAPFVGTLVRAYVTAELRFRIHALALPMPPERSFHRVTLATVRKSSRAFCTCRYFLVASLLVDAHRRRIRLPFYNTATLKHQC